MQRNLFSVVIFLTFHSLFAQTEDGLIKATLLQYINGSSYNRPESIENAFYSEGVLYLDHQEKEVWTVSPSEYASWFGKTKTGQHNGRIGNILSIDCFENIALAKAEILLPAKNKRYVDMFLLKKIQNEWKIISKTASSEASNQSGTRILFIVSNAQYHGSSNISTGNSFSEIVNAYDAFIEAGYTVDFVSPDGGSIPLAYINTSDSLHKKYLYDADFMYTLKHTLKPVEVEPERYKAVHYIGGGSAMYGVPENGAIQGLTMTIYEEYNGIISSVCHGTAGIAYLKDKEGNYLVAGKVISGYPDSYEKQDAKYYEQFPFKIQQTIEEHGGKFTFSPRNTSHVEVMGSVITGQNHLSSRSVVLKIIEKLNDN